MPSSRVATVPCTHHVGAGEQGGNQHAGRRANTQHTRLQEATSARAKDVTCETPSECLQYSTVHATEHARERAHKDNQQAPTTQHARRRRGTRKRKREAAGSRTGGGREGEGEKEREGEGKVWVKGQCGWWCLHPICCQDELRVALLQDGAGLKP